MTQKNIKTENSGQPMAKYDDIISTVFVQNFKKKSRVISFTRDELAHACDQLGIPRIKNLGDIP